MTQPKVALITGVTGQDGACVEMQSVMPQSGVPLAHGHFSSAGEFSP